MHGHQNVKKKVCKRFSTLSSVIRQQARPAAATLLALYVSYCCINKA